MATVRQVFLLFATFLILHTDGSSESSPQLSMKILFFNIVSCDSTCTGHLCTSSMKVLDESTDGMSETIGRYAILRKPGIMLALCYKTEIFGGKVKHLWEASAFRSKMNQESVSNRHKLVILQLTSKQEIQNPSLNPMVKMIYNTQAAKITVTCAIKFPVAENQKLSMMRILHNGKRELLNVRAEQLQGSLSDNNSNITLIFIHQFEYSPAYYRNKFECTATDKYSLKRKSVFTHLINYEREMAPNLLIEVNHKQRLFSKSGTLYAYDDFVNDVTLTCREPIGSPRPHLSWVDLAGRVTNSSRVEMQVSGYDRYCCVASQSLFTETVTRRQCLDLKFKKRSCNDIKLENPSAQSGIYKVYVKFGAEDKLVKVYCDMETDDQGWIVIQKRFDGTQPFDKPWSDYREGFGDLNKEFWLGNLLVHYFTKYRPMKVRMDLWDSNDKYAYAEYSSFALSGEQDYYRLAIGGYSGNASDNLVNYANVHDSQFSTLDRDNDDSSSSSCSKSHANSGWWFKQCNVLCNLNGKYYNPGTSSSRGLIWFKFAEWKSLKRTEIKITY